MNDDLPTAFWIAAQIRIAEKSGVPMVIVHKGDATNGSILLKINSLNGTAEILSQVRLDDERVWTPITDKPHMSEADADAYLARQIDFDPDVWVVEVEDRQGRPWFPGRIVEVT